MKNDIFNYFKFAVELSLKADQKYTNRKACIGAIGIRGDGTIVHSSSAGDQKHKFPNGHAEARVLRKMDKFAPEIYVARIRRDTMQFALARPCITCMPRIKHMKIGKVFYTINEHEYGVIDVARLIEQEGSF